MADAELPQSAVYHDASSGHLFNQPVFQNEDIVGIANAVDKFRAEGLEGDLPLPKVIVAGDQSAGKSSVLESLTGLPFPTGANICTRFATEIILRRARETKVKAIFPASKRGVVGSTRENPASIVREYETLDSNHLMELIKEILALLENTGGVDTGSVANKVPRVSNEILRIEITGPGHVPLSIIDTPGLSYSGNVQQGQEDAPKIESLVRHLISEPRAIILTVMDARKDDISQKIFSLAKEVDANGTRTVGVLTHCDLVETHGEDNRALSLAKNKRRSLVNGWYVLNNRSTADIVNGVSLKSAVANEKAFFARAPWTGLNENKRGADALKAALAQLLAQQNRRELPLLQKEMRAMLETTRRDMARLGSERETPAQQKDFLDDVISSYLSIINACKNGTYKSPSQEVTCPSKIYLHSKQLSNQFVDDMEQSGSRKRFCKVDEKVHDFEDNASGRSFNDTMILAQNNREAIRQGDIYSWINLRLHESVEQNSLGLIPTKLISTLFLEQICPWKEHSVAFVAKVGTLLKRLIQFALEKSCSDNPVISKLLTFLFGKVDEAVKATQETVAGYCSNELLRAATYHPLFTERLAMHRGNRFTADLQRAELIPTTYVRPEKIAQTMSRHFLSAYPRATVYEIHDTLEAYYSTVFWSFVESVRRASDHMITGDSAPLKVLGTDWTRSLSEKELADIARETENTRTKRRILRDKVKRLEQAVEFADQILPRSRFDPPVTVPIIDDQLRAPTPSYNSIPGSAGAMASQSFDRCPPTSGDSQKGFNLFAPSVSTSSMGSSGLQATPTKESTWGQGVQRHSPSGSLFRASPTQTPFASSWPKTLFGSNVFENATPQDSQAQKQGTGTASFQPYTEILPQTNLTERYHSLNFPQPYRDFSPEELRVEYYQQGTSVKC